MRRRLGLARLNSATRAARQGGSQAARRRALVLVLALPGVAKFGELLGFDERQVPGIASDEFIAGVWLVRLDAAGAEQDVDTFTA